MYHNERVNVVRLYVSKNCTLDYTSKPRPTFADPYLVQNFPNFLNLASILTSEAAFQSAASVFFWVIKLFKPS